MTSFLDVIIISNIVNSGLILCEESHKAEENLSIMFMHYVSYDGHMIQGEKA